VTAVIAGWGFAQRPQFLPGLTIEQAAAGRSTLIAMLVALAVGAVVLLPSLGFLFTLVLRGRFDERSERSVEAAFSVPSSSRTQRLLGAAIAGFTVGAGLMIVVDARWALIAGVPMLLSSVFVGFVSLASLVATADAE